jgi:hypothetical protein
VAVRAVRSAVTGVWLIGPPSRAVAAFSRFWSTRSSGSQVSASSGGVSGGACRVRRRGRCG